jgi:hypothetical protein
MCSYYTRKDTYRSTTSISYALQAATVCSKRTASTVPTVVRPCLPVGDQVQPKSDSGQAVFGDPVSARDGFSLGVAYSFVEACD